MRRQPIAPPTMPLTDGFVTVRLRRDDDLGYIAAAADDPEGARWLDEPLDVAPKSAAEIADIWAGGHAAPLLIADAVTDEPAGLINLQRDGADSPTVAYRIFPAWRGRGMAARALELVCAWAFGELGIPRLALEIDEANVASLRVAERCGFTFRGTTQGNPLKNLYVREPPR